MSDLKRWEALAGQWKGQNDLYFMPGDPVRESASAASVALVAKGQFVKIEYDWAYEGDPQEGLMLFGRANDEDGIKIVWVDSWHTGGRIMTSEGTIADSGTITAMTYYSAPTGPDWGWRTILKPGDGAFEILMDNIMPEGEEMRAVEATYSR